MEQNCTSTNPVDITALALGASSTPGDVYGFENIACQGSGFSEGDIIISIFVFWILALIFMKILDEKIFGSKVKIRQ